MDWSTPRIRAAICSSSAFDDDDDEDEDDDDAAFFLGILSVVCCNRVVKRATLAVTQFIKLCSTKNCRNTRNTTTHAVGAGNHIPPMFRRAVNLP